MELRRSTKTVPPTHRRSRETCHAGGGECRPACRAAGAKAAMAISETKPPSIVGTIGCSGGRDRLGSRLQIDGRSQPSAVRRQPPMAAAGAAGACGKRHAIQPAAIKAKSNQPQVRTSMLRRRERNRRQAKRPHAIARRSTGGRWRCKKSNSCARNRNACSPGERRPRREAAANVLVSSTLR